MGNFQNDLLKVINEKLDALYFEMRELDRKYIEKQKEVRLLKKRKEEYYRLAEKSLLKE
ncbi:hypothetical protein [Bacillus atrophaeus]|uniref:hypothetical protein n=1 Tax=Bacillus atrophaeus TaxID=1452 RepID=UPI001C108B0F|nr:hypothetical protein [Bacillus atrophaeus]MBU5262091.1 hypothetical protein [Bacillus atrophaeus]